MLGFLVMHSWANYNMDCLKRVSDVLLGMRRTSSYQSGQWRSKILEWSSQMKTDTRRCCTAVNKSSECSTDDQRLKNPRVASLVEVTVGEGIRPIDLLHALEKSPELLNKSPLQWENCFKELKHYGFTHRDCLSMVSQYPDLITMVEGNGFRLAMKQWIDCQLGYDNVLDLLAYCPHYLSISFSELSSRIPLLYSLGKSNGRNVTRLLKNCPSLLYGNWKDVEAKLDYVEKVMKIDTKEENVSKCYMFNRTLDEIQTRHVFLQRAGIYVTPGKVKGTKLEQKQQPWRKNPRLNDITDTNEEVFISEVASDLTLEEFEVFREVYIEELNKEDNSEPEDGLSDNE